MFESLVRWCFQRSRGVLQNPAIRYLSVNGSTSGGVQAVAEYAGRAQTARVRKLRPVAASSCKRLVSDARVRSGCLLQHLGQQRWNIVAVEAIQTHALVVERCRVVVRAQSSRHCSVVKYGPIRASGCGASTSSGKRSLGRRQNDVPPTVRHLSVTHARNCLSMT